MCNREMKFGIFQDYALKQGFDAIATGHYVQKVANPNGTYDILKESTPIKINPTSLALLSQSQIKNAEFPIGY